MLWVRELDNVTVVFEKFEESCIEFLHNVQAKQFHCHDMLFQWDVVLFASIPVYKQEQVMQFSRKQADQKTLCLDDIFSEVFWPWKVLPTSKI